jgi:MoaA/NifB/PqqE/SkfB family radical SAM enzyme
VGPIRTYRIDTLKAPLMVSWQITRDCDLCCVHCCTESAPGKRLPDELDAEDAQRLADEIIRAQVPYVMLCGGEPLLAPHCLSVAERLGAAGVQLKIETNGQRCTQELVARLERLPLRSVQVSLDGDSPEVYRRQRAGGELEKAHAACRALRAAGVPLEVTFAPTRINIHELPAVIERARDLGAFRFNTGQLMRIGTAARRWRHLEPDREQYHRMRSILAREQHRLGAHMELCYQPFTVQQALGAHLEEPPATLLVLPNGAVKVAAALPYVCADLRHESLGQAWERYRRAWRSETVRHAARNAIADDANHAAANAWRAINMSMSSASESPRVEEQ